MLLCTVGLSESLVCLTSLASWVGLSAYTSAIYVVLVCSLLRSPRVYIILTPAYWPLSFLLMTLLTLAWSDAKFAPSVISVPSPLSPLSPWNVPPVVVWLCCVPLSNLLVLITKQNLQNFSPNVTSIFQGPFTNIFPITEKVISSSSNLSFYLLKPYLSQILVRFWVPVNLRL